MSQHFAAIALPGPAYRRSFFADAFLRQTSTFVRLLCQLAPDRYRSLRDKSPLSVYDELLDYCGTLFPVFEPNLDYVFELDEGAHANMAEAEAAEEFGVPVKLQGINDDDVLYGSSPTFCFIALLSSRSSKRGAVENLSAIGKSFMGIRALRPFFDREIHRSKSGEKALGALPPHGRAWAGRWQSITELVNYVWHQTGYVLLDATNQEMAEYDETYGPWDIDHIRYYAKSWKESKPMLDRITAFQRWLDERPAERLPLLAAAITGDKAVRQQLSQPKKKSKRLIEVL